MGFASISAEIHHADFSDSHFTNQNIRIVGAAIALPKDLPDITYGALDDDGSVERTSWVKPDDGLLVYDWNDNGLVDSGGELFRTRFSRADYMAGFVDTDDFNSAFNELYTFDSNGDGRISVGDLQYDGFKIWQDANGNGVTDAGELKTLSEAGIASIDVSYTRVNQDLGDGNTRFDRGRATRTDGRVVEASDIFFAVEGNDANGEVYNPDVAGLPFVRILRPTKRILLKSCWWRSRKIYSKRNANAETKNSPSFDLINFSVALAF